MRIFVLGVGGAGSLLAQLLARQGHTVWCGDRDPERARKFLGKKSKIEVVEANARNLWSIVRAARGCNLLVNASPAVFNEIILRAALRLRSHYLDLNSHLNRNPFRPEQFRFQKRFAAKNRAAVICTGAAPGLTNLLAKRGSELLDIVEAVQIRLFESTESKDPVSTWSPEVMYDEAISSPRVYEHGRFALAKRFTGREKFRFPPPIGQVTVYLAAQDEVCMLPYVVRMREMDAKMGGINFVLFFHGARRGGGGSGPRRRSAGSAAVLREFSDAFADSAARIDFDADCLCDGASGGDFCETFSAGHGRSVWSVRVAAGNATGDSERRAYAGFSDRVQDDPAEEKRRRRILARCGVLIRCLGAVPIVVVSN